MHGDHAGNAHNKAPNSGTCEQPDMSVSAMPNSNAVNIAVAKKSKIVTGSEMPPFFAAKLKANGGNPADSILARFGGSVTSAECASPLTAMHSGAGPAIRRRPRKGGRRPASPATSAYRPASCASATASRVPPPGDTGITADQGLIAATTAKLAVAARHSFTTNPAGRIRHQRARRSPRRRSHHANESAPSATGSPGQQDQTIKASRYRRPSRCQATMGSTALGVHVGLRRWPARGLRRRVLTIAKAKSFRRPEAP
jgi:hypothetical protein